MEKDLVKKEIPESPEIVEIEIPKSTPSEKKSELPDVKPKRKYKPRAPKTSTPAKKVDNSKIGVSEINSMLCGIFGLVALKGGEHWNITPEEANSVSVPLTNILDKLNITERVANVSDGAMLCVAAATITIPRILITNEINKSKKLTKNEKIVSELTREVKPNETKGNNIETGKSNFSRIAEITTNDLQPAAPVYFSDPQ
jgi:hypothetical protein